MFVCYRDRQYISHHNIALCSWITYGVNIDRQPGSCVQRHCLHCVFIRGVGGIPHCTVIVGLLLHEDWGACSEGGGGT